MTRYQQTQTVTVSWHFTTLFIMQSQTFLFTLYLVWFIWKLFFFLARFLDQEKIFTHSKLKSERHSNENASAQKHCNRKQRITNQSIVLFLCLALDWKRVLCKFKNNFSCFTFSSLFKLQLCLRQSIFICHKTPARYLFLFDKFSRVFN